MRAGSFSDLSGWAGDDLSEAARVYDLTRSAGAPRPVPDVQARAFFEQSFRPVAVPEPALVTGYYEPVLAGSLTPTDRFRYPLHAMPATKPAQWPTRAGLRQTTILDGCELVWLADPLEAFLAQVQGALRVRLDGTGATLRLGYAGRNGHPYRSIGALLVQRGEVAADAISADRIRSWCITHPAQVQDLLDENPSYVFFRQLDLPESEGPVGSVGVALTAMRSVATDPDDFPAGALLWLSLDGIAGFPRLCVAQDTGSAIKGPARIDLFCGTGTEAGHLAGNLKAQARIVRLIPREPAP